jgi:DNA polymerase III subunit delta'
LAQSGCLDDCSNVDFRQEIAHQASRLDPMGVRDYLRLLVQVEGYLHHTVNTGLAMDVLLLQLPRPIS